MSGDHTSSRRSSNRASFDSLSVAARSHRITKNGKSLSNSQTLNQCVKYKSKSESDGATMCSSSTRNSNVPRTWIYSPLDSSAFTDKLVIVSYNILGVENASNHPDLYYNIMPECLDWNNRKQLIFKEIKHYSSDICCFQEVDRFQDLNYGLREDGFRGVYKARTGDANDGCAIFWKEERFTLLQEEHIEFQKFGLRDNVAQFCVLKMTIDQDKSDNDVSKSKTAVSSRCLVVGNIHVLYNPKRGDVKLGQIRLFLKKAHKLSEEWGGIPVILAGDFNSVPQSALYRFMSTKKLDILKHDRKRISGQIGGGFECRAFCHQNEYSRRPNLFEWSSEELELATGYREETSLQNPLKLSSAYHGVPASSYTRDHLAEPLATSYHSMFMGTVDYLWHTEDLAPVRVLNTLPIDALRKIGGLPSQILGSDHLALVCEFAFTETVDCS